MTDLLRAVSSELLKLKRTLALRLAVGAPLAVVVLTFVITSQRRTATAAEINPLLGFAQLNLTTWTIIVLPLYAALAATLVAGIEHQHDNWKHLLALPLSRVSIFAAKWHPHRSHDFPAAKRRGSRSRCSSGRSRTC